MSLGLLEIIVLIVGLLVLAAWFPWGAVLQHRYTRPGDHDSENHDEQDDSGEYDQPERSPRTGG